MDGVQIPLDGRKGSRPSSRKAAIRLSRLTPNLCFPAPHPPGPLEAVRRCSHTGQTPVDIDVLGNLRGTGGRSMTSRVRWVQPPDQPGAATGTLLQHMLHPLGGTSCAGGR